MRYLHVAMCDTQVLFHGGFTWFAKNSDREPGEPQPVVRLPPVRDDRQATVRTTYLEIPQSPRRHGVILSKPVWTWGAEMGANDRGVVIGNEAIFSRLAEKKPALLGMDLVRLGLERGATAREALTVITALLELHGQGGSAGYRDKRFHYDNSFVLADAAEAWVLETAGRHWVAKRVEGSAAISNCLTIGTDYDLASEGLEDFGRERGLWRESGRVDFARAFDTRLLPRLARAHERVALAHRCLAETRAREAAFSRMAGHLRRHARGNESPLDGGNGDLCMHAAGPVRRSQSCGSMISRLAPGDARHLLTGTSAPCLSIFRPVAFDDAPYSVLHEEDAADDEMLWRRHEPVHRRALFDEAFRGRLREERDRAEQRIFDLVSAPATGVSERAAADGIARGWQERQEALAGRGPWRFPLTPAGIFWRRQNALDGLAAPVAPRAAAAGGMERTA